MRAAVRFLEQWRAANHPAGLVAPGQDAHPEWAAAQQSGTEMLRAVLGAAAPPYVQKALAQTAELRAKVPDAGREPPLYWSIVGTCALVEAAARRLGHEVPGVLADVLGGWELNVRCLRAGAEQEYVLLFSSRLKAFTELMAALAASAWVQLPRPMLGAPPDYLAVRDAVEDRADLSRQMARILLAALGRADLDAVRRTADLPAVAIAPLMDMSAEAFLVAHEYAHVLGGHLCGLPAPEAGIHVWLIDGTPVEVEDEVMRRWDQEAHADGTALEVLFQLCGLVRLDVDIAYAGVELSLGAMHLLERAAWIVDHGHGDIPARVHHPPCYLRRELTRRGLARALAKAFPQVPHAAAADQLLAVGRLLECVLQVLFDGALPYLVAAHVELAREKQRSPLDERLYRAVNHEQFAEAHELLDRGARAGFREPPGSPNAGVGPLHWAAYYGDLSLVRRLVECGAAVGARDALGRSPLVAAALAGHADVVRFLLERGAALDELGYEGWTAIPPSRRHPEVVKVLREHGYAS